MSGILFEPLIDHAHHHSAVADALLVTEKLQVIKPSSDTTDSNATVLQAIYDPLRERGVWPTFAQVDRVLDRHLGIEDAQAALAGLPAEWLPRAWNRVSYS